MNRINVVRVTDGVSKTVLEFDGRRVSTTNLGSQVQSSFEGLRRYQLEGGGAVNRTPTGFTDGVHEYRLAG